MKTTTTINHRGREIELTAGNKMVNGTETVAGRLDWTKNNYAEFATFYVRTVGNEKTQIIEWDSSRMLSKTMKAELTKKLAAMFIQN